MFTVQFLKCLVRILIYILSTDVRCIRNNKSTRIWFQSFFFSLYSWQFFCLKVNRYWRDNRHEQGMFWNKIVSNGLWANGRHITVCLGGKNVVKFTGLNWKQLLSHCTCPLVTLFNIHIFILFYAPLSLLRFVRSSFQRVNMNIHKHTSQYYG